MSDLVIEAGDCSADEILTAINDGKRVTVRTEFLGSTHDVTLRFDGDIYYCDTPTRLHKHETEAEMLGCIEEQGYCDESDGD